MTRILNWLQALVLSLTGLAAATPALPNTSLATNAVRDALSAAAPAPVVSQQAASNAAQKRAEAVAQATRSTSAAVTETPIAAARSTGRTAIVRATAYNSLPNQTDSTPFITATGTRVRPGVVALSRDLLRQFPYGSRITIEDLSGRYNFKGRVFVVEDTMAARKRNSLDIWMGTRTEAINFGARQLRITAVR
ncbi:3D domain-containing protein [Deinococcus deserti]|uniref:3D domain-containing protein n=1 Tax=Deinococcus deserti (strain DSM 17065 / CIP 109153 / LMG 22923 / VCD115) TaxID=546414 RepID=C1D1M1_DEIDV|nr:3D domain-containing protein [Deinococcus deserti]ACO45745.1 conserved hypothetical protein, precursor [Deinococcus deserti VCD115]